MLDPFALIREIDACDGRTGELVQVMEDLARVCHADVAWFMTYNLRNGKDVVYLPLRFPDGAKTWLTAEGAYPWQLWANFASSLSPGELMQTERFDRSLAMHHLSEFFKEYDILQTIGFTLRLSFEEQAGLAFFRAEGKGPFNYDAARYLYLTMDAFLRFSRRNWIQRRFGNPLERKDVSLELFRQRIQEKGLPLRGRLAEACWLFYQEWSEKEIAARMRPTALGRPPTARTIAAYLERAREHLAVPSRVALMKAITKLIDSPFPGER